MSIFTNSASSTAEEHEAYAGALLGLLGDDDPIPVLKETPALVRRAVAGLPEAALGRREAPGKWSVRHVLRHLADGEVVFAFRLRMILAHDRPTLPGYDQDAWADRLGYAEAPADLALDDFETVRRSNVALLERCSAADLERVGLHAERGEESVARMARLYAGHDRLHLRQIERIRAAIAAG